MGLTIERVRFPRDLFQSRPPEEKTGSLKLQRDGANEDTHILIIRYQFHPLLIVPLTPIATTAFELLIKRVWYRSIARVRRLRSARSSPDTSTTRASPAPNLPLEIVEMIIAHLVYDTNSLRTCTMTCYSWYLAAVPHLHNILITHTNSLDRKFRWPNPLRHMHALGLFPLVEILWVHRDYGNDSNNNGNLVFSSKQFNHRILRQTSALVNVQRLMVDNLDISSFMPRIQQYFKNFLPTVRELVLAEPKGTRRQITYFVGLFQHLEDLEIHYGVDFSGEPVDNLMLIPPFAPPLRGWLRLSHLTGVGLLEDMIYLYGGLRFSYMALCNVEGTKLLLEACAETLKELELYPTDPRGEPFSGNFRSSS